LPINFEKVKVYVLPDQKDDKGGYLKMKTGRVDRCNAVSALMRDNARMHHLSNCSGVPDCDDDKALFVHPFILWNNAAVVYYCNLGH
jgi:hypothetical protein